MAETGFGRREFLGAATAIVVVPAGTARAETVTAAGDSDFTFEITRSDAEWRERLGDEGYRILREGGTEAKHSSPLVDETRDGVYCCRGCDLPVYESVWKVQLDIGWVFFRQCQPNSVLTGIDGPAFDGTVDLRIISMIEAHCRRCGSHLGHIQIVEGQLLHCINGASLDFAEA